MKILKPPLKLESKSSIVITNFVKAFQVGDVIVMYIKLNKE